MSFSIENVDKSKCSKYNEPVIIGSHIIKHRGSKFIITIYDTITNTCKLNEIAYRAAKRHLHELGYESYYNKNSLMRLRKEHE